MEVRLLGPVELRLGDRVVPGGPPQQRAMLAALAVDVGRPVLLDTLVDRIWGDAPPSRARQAIYVHIAHIRQLLEKVEHPAPLVRRSGGYALVLPSERVDTHRFQALVRAAGGGGQLDAVRADQLWQALGLWRGTPLADVPGEWAARVREAWHHQRVTVAGSWAEAMLRLGDPHAVIQPLVDLLTEYPTAESLMTSLLRALHATGRTAEAIERFTAMRQMLVAEFGTDPGADLASAYRFILQNTGHHPLTRPDAVLSHHPHSTPVEASGREAPPKAERTLPADVTGFVGRHEELQHLLAAVDNASAGSIGAVAIHAVDGMAGVGKTAFAVHAAHHLASRFPDGQRFVDLRAHAPGQSAVDPAAALEILLQADGVAAQQIPAGLDARAGLWRERMADRKMLLVLDDAADAAHVAPLLPAAPGCLVLITSRRKLVRLPGATLLSLDVLPPAVAAQLFVERARRRADDDEAATRRITRLCGYLPLAITLTAARLHVHPTWRVTDLADDLERARDRLTELASGELAVAAAFDLSYRDLPADRQRLFRRLSLHPGPDFDAYAAAALDHMAVTAARRGLEDLLEHNLLTEPHRGRYRLHDLIAAHARSQAASDPGPERDAALDRLLTYYLRTATTAAVQQDAGFVPVATAISADGPSAEAPPIADPQQAGDWFTAEVTNLAAAVTDAANRHHPAAIAIPAALYEHLRNRGPWDLAIRLHHAALTAAQQTDDRPAQGQTLINLAHMELAMGAYPVAATAAEQARTVYERLGDRRGQANSLEILARVPHALGDYPAAAAAARQARTLYRRLGDRRGQANSLEILARVQYLTGNFPAAAAAAEQARTLYQQVGDRRGLASSLDTVAFVRYATGNFPAAAAAAEQARTLHEQVGNQRGQANALEILARVRHATGDYPAAATAAERAHTLHQQIGNRHGRAFALHALALVHHATGDHPAAAAAAEQARGLFEQMGSPQGMANAVQVLGIVHHATTDHPAAAAALEQALRLFRELGDPDGEAETLNHIGQLHLDSTTPATAHQQFSAALDIARRIGTPIHEARALEGMGTCLLRQGHHNDGVQYLRDALTIYQRIHSSNTSRVESSLNEVAGLEQLAP